MFMLCWTITAALAPPLADVLDQIRRQPAALDELTARGPAVSSARAVFLGMV